MKLQKFVVLLIVGGAMFLASAGIAATGSADEGSSLLLSLFVGFFALIVVFQLIPACLMFGGMVRGLFREKNVQETGSNVKN